MVVLQMDDAIRDDPEVILEVPEDLRISAGPGVHRLLVVADGEDVPVILRQPTHDRVLDRIQVLELVDQNDVPARTNPGCDIVHAEQLRRLENESVEVGDVALDRHPLVPLVVPLIPLAECIAAESIA